MGEVGREKKWEKDGLNQPIGYYFGINPFLVYGCDFYLEYQVLVFICFLYRYFS